MGFALCHNFGVSEGSAFLAYFLIYSQTVACKVLEFGMYIGMQVR